MINRVPNRQFLVIAVLLTVVGLIGSGCSSSAAAKKSASAPNAKKNAAALSAMGLSPSKKDFNNGE